MLKNILLNKKRNADALIAKAKIKEDAENLSKCKSYVTNLFDIRAKDFALQYEDNYIRVNIDEYVFRYCPNGTILHTRIRHDLLPVERRWASHSMSFFRSRTTPTFYQINVCPDCNNELFKRIDNYIHIEKLDLDEIIEHYCGSDEQFENEKKIAYEQYRLGQKEEQVNNDKKHAQTAQPKTKCSYCGSIVSSEKPTCEKCGGYLN